MRGAPARFQSGMAVLDPTLDAGRVLTLALIHDLADLELHAGDHAILRCAQRRILQAIAREVELSRFGFGAFSAFEKKLLASRRSLRMNSYTLPRTVLVPD